MATAAGLFCGWQGLSFVSPGAPGARQLRAGGFSKAGQQPDASAPVLGATATTVMASTALAACGLAASRRRVARNAEEVAPKGKEVATKEATQDQILRPEILGDSPKFPKFLATTSGYISRSTRERHAITWTAKEEEWFEMPTGPMALMNKGENLCYFRKKEPCIALGKALRKMKIDNYKIYRIDKHGNVEFMHPADGVFPEKVNKGRVQVNGRPFSIGENPLPCFLKGTRYSDRTYEADPLTTMFLKARIAAWDDLENMMPLPRPQGWIQVEEDDDGKFRKVVPGSAEMGQLQSL